MGYAKTQIPERNRKTQTTVIMPLYGTEDRLAAGLTKDAKASTTKIDHAITHSVLLLTYLSINNVTSPSTNLQM